MYVALTFNLLFITMRPSGVDPADTRPPRSQTFNLHTGDKMEHGNKENIGHEGGETKVSVAVSTTSGFFPDTGFEQVPISQKIKVMLEKAKAALKLTDTGNWVATVDKKVINPELSFEENNLHGEIEVDWGPSEGGGGHA